MALAKIYRMATTSLSRDLTQGDLNPVGMIVASMLTEAQFQNLNGTSWVLAYGQSIVGSSYATITGNTLAPDLRGRALAAADNMGGGQGNVLTTGTGGFGASRNTIGGIGGVDAHTLTVAQSGTTAHAHTAPFHTHDEGIRFSPTGTYYITEVAGDGTPQSLAAPPAAGPQTSWSRGKTGNQSNTAINAATAADASAAHPNVQPTMIVNYFIKIN